MSLAKILRRKRTSRISKNSHYKHGLGARLCPLLLEQLEARNMLTTLFTPQFGAEQTFVASGPGAPLQSVPLCFTFWGSYWTTGNGPQQESQILNAAETMCGSGFFSDEKAEYQTDGKVGLDDWVINTSNPPQGFTQSQLNQAFQSEIDSGALPESDNSIVGQAEYVVVTPPGILSNQPGDLGYNAGTYHSLNFSYVSENFIWDGGGASTTFNLDTYTTVLSHEVAELTVNPVGYSALNGIERVGYTVNPGASFLNAPLNSNQICDYEVQNYTARLGGVDVQSYWSQQYQDFIIPDNNTQGFFVDNGVLSLVGGQNGIVNNTFSVELTSLGGLEADMNGESVVFDPGEISSVNVVGGAGHDTLNIGTGILGHINVDATFGNTQPFLFNNSQLTIQGDQLGTAYNDSIFIGSSQEGLQATENGDSIIFQPGAISSIQVNLGSGNEAVELSGDVPAVVSNIVFANIGTPGNDTLTVDNDTAVADAAYSVGLSTSVMLSNPLNIDYTGWLNPVAYLSNFTAVTLDMADASSGGDTNVVNVQNLFPTTTLNVELGLGSETVNMDGPAGTEDIFGNVNISDDPNPGSSTINIVVNDQGDSASRDISLSNMPQPGWGSITGLGLSGSPQINYQYSAATTLTLDSDAAVGNSINVDETGVTTDVQIDAVTYVSLGDYNVGTQDLLGSVSMSSYEGGTPDQGNLYVTLNDLADPTPRTATLTTFTPEVSYGHGFFGPDTPWGSISGMTASPTTITYEYADTHSVTILGNSGDQIVNHQTGSGQTPVALNTAPIVTSISPAEGPLSGGTVVAIHGSGFTGSPWVSFGNSVLFPDTNYQNTSSVLYVITPPSSTVGAVNLYVWNNVTLSSAVQFTYVAAPTVTEVSPSVGPALTHNTVTIDGEGFYGAAVYFGGVAGTIVSDTLENTGVNHVAPYWQIVASTPLGTPGTVGVTVTTPGGPSNSLPYTYTAAPVVTSVTPWESGLAGGANVTILGSGFSDVTAVYFGGTKVTSFTIVSSGQITVTSPPSPTGAADTVYVTVATNGGTSAESPANEYTYLAPPVVTSISSPNFGPYEGGTTVTINGNNLSNLGSLFPVVRFGATVGTVTSDNGTQIVVTSPFHTVGVVDVTVSTTGGTSPINQPADEFDYEYVTPIINKVSPSTGAASGGTAVTITGDYLLSTQQVYFGSVVAPSFQVNTDTQITAICPPGAAGAQVDVTVVAEGLQSAKSSADLFTYATLPIVSGLSPSSGPVGGGSSVTITGTNLTGATAVDFGGVAVPVNPAQDTGTQLIITSPAGVAGVVDVTVVAPNGTSATSSADKFTYYVPVAAPVVTSLSQSSGPVGVQTTLTIFGSGLSDPTAVDFGDVPGTIESYSDNQISVEEPCNSHAGHGPRDGYGGGRHFRHECGR